MNSPAQRQSVLDLLKEALSAGARLASACLVLGVSPRCVQRWRAPDTAPDGRTQRLQAPANKLTDDERSTILAVANSPQFAHLPPSQMVPILADQGDYIASESTIYRTLREAKQLAHRAATRAPQVRAKPKALCATAPNQIYSWDITYLPTTVKGVYFYLYLVMDIFSRKIVGWQVYQEESSTLAGALLTDICLRENVAKDQVVLHSDNGAPMKGATMLATLQNLGVATSFSRPAVSNDNPYSESLFKTLKYRPEMALSAFENLIAARHSVTQLVHWYNDQHRHSAIQFVTPSERHANEDAALLARRHAVYQQARETHPERWTGTTRNWTRIAIVHLNPNKAASSSSPTNKDETGVKKTA